MPVTKQMIMVPIAGSLNTKVDPKQIQISQLRELTNGVITKQGLLEKRTGYTILSSNIEGGGTIQMAAAISAFQDELLHFDGARVRSLIEATGNWLDRGPAVSVIATDRTILRQANRQQLNCDVAALNGAEVYAWEDSTNGVRYSVIDAKTGAFAVSDGLVSSTGLRPKTIAFNGLVYILYSDGVNNIFARAVNPLNPTAIQNEIVLIADGYNGGVQFGWDAAVIGGKLMIAFLSQASTQSIVVQGFNANLTGAGSQTVETNAAKCVTAATDSCLNVVGDSSNNVWVSWGSGVDVRTSCVAGNLGSILLADTLVDVVRIETLTGVEHTSAGELLLTYEEYNATPWKARIHTSTITLTGVVTLIGTLRSVGLASKAWKNGAQRYVNVAIEFPVQKTYLTVQIGASTFPLVAKIGAGVGQGLRSNSMLSEAVEQSPGIFLWANSVAGKITAEAGLALALVGAGSTKLDFFNSNRFLSVTGANSLLFVGGILSNYDGVSVTEHGFVVNPEAVVVTPLGSGGSLSAGSYFYAVVYEWTDNRGQIHRSAPWFSGTITTVLNDAVSVEIPTLRVTAKQGLRSNPSLVVYRTEVNGSVFHRVTSAFAPKENDPSVDTVTFVDDVADVDMAGNEDLYTTGEVLPNDAPPACKLIASNQSRVFLGGLEDPNLLWFSKNRFDNSSFNTIPVEFSAAQTIAVDPRGGPITALGNLDEKLIIWKRGAIFAVAGEGPNDAGTGQNFPDPTLMSGDVGCISPNTVVRTDQGIIFKSAKGWYQLDRSGSLSYIGAAVEAYNDLEATSATLVEDQNLVILTHSNGVALVYNYFFQQWSTWANHQAEDSDIYDDRLVFVRANGKVYKSDPTKFTDGGAPIFLSFVIPDLSLAQLNGFQRVFRVYLLGTYKGTHKLRVQVAYDFSDTYSQSALVDNTTGTSTWGSDPTWGSGSPWGGEYNPYQIRFDFSQQVCTSIRLKVSDEQTAPYTEGFSISALSFEVGVYPKGYRVPPKRTYGTT